MKIGIINDTHWGARNDSKFLIDHQRTFFNETFFPYLKKNNISTIIHAGDVFDRRKYINFVTLSEAKDMFFDRLLENDIQMWVVLGNHDCFYKNHNNINSVELLLSEYPNIHVIRSTPQVIKFDTLDIGLFPWICEDNQKVSLEMLQNMNVSTIIGHFEIQGFEVVPGVEAMHGLKTSMFNNYELVLSGHFHNKSSKGNITYLGTQYEMDWSNYGSQKGFHVLDTSTRSLEFIKNPKTFFTKMYYDDAKEDYTNFDCSVFTNQYIKLIVSNKTNTFMFDSFVDKIMQSNPVDLAIIEEDINIEVDSFNITAIDDTPTIMNSYVDNLDIDIDKLKIKTVMKDLYVEALEVV